MPLTEIPRTFNYNEFNPVTYTQIVRTDKSMGRVCMVPHYTFTDLDLGASLFKETDCITLVEESENNYLRQMGFINFSQRLLMESKPLDSRGLSVMSKTSSRLFSKTPTRL
jgi:hypothetical protein